jgi:hypothetical protein
VYEHVTGDVVRRQAQRNLIAACYRVHGDDLLPLVLETFERTGTAINLLGELRVLRPRQPRPAADPDSPTPSDRNRHQTGASVVGGQVRLDQPAQVDPDSAWCGCPEEVLRPGLLYCEDHQPRFGSAPTLRHDRRESNPAAARFFAARRQSATEAPRP